MPLRGFFSVILVALLPSLAFAQHLGEREQWQPQTASVDPRLDQPVEIEIIGRAAVPALEMLSEQTGVSLGVASENLDTVGERKCTIIAKGLPLRAIMVQLPEALQEAHWDVVDCEGELVYLLHRNAGVSAAFQRERQQDRETYVRERQASRAARIEEVKRALTMSPEELEELEQTDLFLARAAREPLARAMMEAFVNLPADSIEEFIEAGRVEFAPGEIPRAAVRVARLAIQQLRRWLEWVHAWPPEEPKPPFYLEIDWRSELDEAERKLANGQGVAIRLREFGTEDGMEIVLHFEGGGGPVVPARRPRSPTPASYGEYLLVQTGDTRAGAAETVERLAHEQVDLREGREWDEGAWVAPEDPRLQQRWSVEVGPDDTVRLVDVEREIAAETGLSLVADYFENDRIGVGPEQPSLEGPIWRALHILGVNGHYEWQLVGDCLVFRRVDWYGLAQGELPESVVVAYREKLGEQCCFTLDDVVALSVEARSHQSLYQLAEGMHPPANLPEELAEAGAGALLHPRHSWAQSLLASLTPEQRSQAEVEAGLGFADMTAQQRDHVSRLARGRFRKDTLEPAPEAVFTITRSEIAEHGRTGTRHELRLTFSDDDPAPLSVTVDLPRVDSEPTR